MTIQQQIENYISTQPSAKAAEMRELHAIIQTLMPACKLWYLDGKNEEGKVVSNPNIGYGQQKMTYADGSSREFYQIGLSANTTGISVYIMGIEDKKYLSEKYAAAIGKATVTGYCIKFKSLKTVDVEVLKAALRDGAMPR
jgi:hypothetical protein